MNGKTILIGSESPNVVTGYGSIIRRMFKRYVGNNEVHVMGWQYHGMSINFDGFYLHDAGLAMLGDKEFPSRLEPLIMDIKPDLYFSLIDIWYTKRMVELTNRYNIPYINYFPIDSHPIPKEWIKYMMESTKPITLSHYGVNTILESAKRWFDDKEIKKLEEKLEYLYHGVDINVYNQKGRHKARERLITLVNTLAKKDVVNDDTFFIYIGNRNVIRKNIPAALYAIKKFIRLHPNTMIIMKVGMWDDMNNGHNLYELTAKLGLTKHIISIDDEDNPLIGLSDEKIAETLKAADVYLSTTTGEGFGLWTIEAMACGAVPLISNNTTAPEIVIPGTGELINCPTFIVSKYNTKMYIVDVEDVFDKLIWAYQNPGTLDDYRKEGWRHIKKTFDWKVIHRKFDSIVQKL